MKTTKTPLKRLLSSGKLTEERSDKTTSFFIQVVLYFDIISQTQMSGRNRGLVFVMVFSYNPRLTKIVRYYALRAVSLNIEVY